MGSRLYGLLKNSSESFDAAQDERENFDIIDDFPFMLRLSKHSEPFSTTCKYPTLASDSLRNLRKTLAGFFFTGE